MHNNSDITDSKIEQCHKVNSFLKHFLFVEGGVYSIFGDKPLSMMMIFKGEENHVAQLTEEELKTAIFIDDSLSENWEAWKNFVNQISLKNFLFVERPSLYDPDHILYFVMNIKRVEQILKENQKAFHDKTGFEMAHLSKVINEFKNPESQFWDKVFADHYLSGLLFGYGEENITYFLGRIKNPDSIKANKFSDTFNPSASQTNFPIPIFAVSPEDRKAKEYKKQRKKIQKIYKNKDLVDITLERLTHS